MGREWTPEQRQAASEAMKKRNEAKQSEARKARVPLADSRDKMHCKTTPAGYHDHWINDDGKGRLQRVRDAGYEHVGVDGEVIGDLSVDNSNVGSVVSRNVGNGITSYLMRQRIEHYEEDQRAKQAEVDSTEEGLRRSEDKPKGDGLIGKVEIGHRR